MYLRKVTLAKDLLGQAVKTLQGSWVSERAGKLEQPRGLDSGWQRCGQWPAAGSGALKTTVAAQVLLKEAAITFLTSAMVWPQTEQQGGNPALPIYRQLD